jgi:hypothetical protein
LPRPPPPPPPPPPPFGPPLLMAGLLGVAVGVLETPPPLAVGAVALLAMRPVRLLGPRPLNLV